jgi:hypothetical protein
MLLQADQAVRLHQIKLLKIKKTLVLQEEEYTKIINSLIDRYLTKKKSEKMEM